MNIAITNSLSTGSYTPAQKTAGKSGFANVLQEQYKSAEAKRMEDMTEAVKALDKALEAAEKENPVKLSSAQLDWLRGRYDVRDMKVQLNGEKTVNSDGSITEFSLGNFLTEEHGNLLDDLHALGLLSEHDMEILNRANLSLMPVVPPDDRWAVYDNEGNRSGWLMPTEAQPSWQKFFNESLNPNWRSDIAGYHKAMAEMHTAVFELLERENRLGFSGVPNNWYEESAEVRTRLADILEQIFNS